MVVLDSPPEQFVTFDVKFVWVGFPERELAWRNDVGMGHDPEGAIGGGTPVTGEKVRSYTALRSLVGSVHPFDLVELELPELAFEPDGLVQFSGTPAGGADGGNGHQTALELDRIIPVTVDQVEQLLFHSLSSSKDAASIHQFFGRDKENLPPSFP